MGQLENMQVFVRIVESGSISRAAQQLNVAKSVVSRRLAELEQSLGTTLLNRTTRASSLTLAGREYYARAQVLIDAFSELHSQFDQAERPLDGTLKLAVPVTFGLSHLSAPLAAFNRLYPQLVLDVDFSDRKVDIVEEGYDLAFRIAHLEDSNLQARKICQIGSYMVASPAYLKDAPHLHQAADLHQHKLLRYTGNRHSSYAITSPSGELQRLQFSASTVANNGDFLCQMAIAGCGVALLPSFIVKKPLERGELTKVLDDHTFPSINAYVVYPSSKFLARRARVFIDFLVDWFEKTPL
ncbi:MAG: LysR family transcriptional regulator [Pseudomonadales bacterium]